MGLLWVLGGVVVVAAPVLCVTACILAGATDEQPAPRAADNLVRVAGEHHR